MFNFDMFGIANYKISGLVRVSVSDAFNYSDYLSRNYSFFYSALHTNDEVPWTPSMLDGIQSVLATYSQFINLQFDWKGDYDFIGSDTTANPEDVGRAAVSDINISWINRPDVNFSGISGGKNELVFKYEGGAGDIFLNNAFLPFNFDGNSTTRQTLIHELGHSLGLSHPHSGYNYTTDVPTISPDFAATQYLGFKQLGFSINSAADMYKEYFTVMSYDDQISSLPNSNYVYRSYTPMILDVIALQQAYGEGAGTSGSGNDTINAGTAGYRTYFDTGGVDTVDLTSYSDAAYLNMGVSITGAAHLVGVAMSKFDAQNTILSSGNPTNLRWLYGEYENAIGSSSDDFIVGNALDNKIEGRGSDDKFIGLAGNDTIDGGEGIDILLLTGNRADFSFIKNTTGYTIKDNKGTEGTDFLTNVERLEFTDKTIALDIEANAGQTYRVYKAAFNRTPDNDGLKYWIQMMDGGKKLSEVASGFIASNEFKSLYGANPTSDQFVGKLYNNVLGRAPDAGGFNYWVGLLDNKQIDMTSMLVNFSESTENKAAVIGVIQNGIELI